MNEGASRAISAVSAVGRHLISAILSIAFLTFVPILAYFILLVVGAIFYNDVGGPLNIIFVPLCSVVMGVSVTILIYAPVALFFEFWKRKRRVPVVVPPFLFCAVLFLFFSLVLTLADGITLIEHVAVALGFGLFFGGGFCIYWFAAALIDGVISFIRRKKTRHNADT